MSFLLILEKVILIAGLLVFLYSIFRYVQRTRDIRGVLHFWAKKMAMNPTEFRINRAGIVIMLVGVALRFVNQLHLFG